VRIPNTADRLLLCRAADALAQGLLVDADGTWAPKSTDWARVHGYRTSVNAPGGMPGVISEGEWKGLRRRLNTDTSGLRRAVLGLLPWPLLARLKPKEFASLGAGSAALAGLDAEARHEALAAVGLPQRPVVAEAPAVTMVELTGRFHELRWASRDGATEPGRPGSAVSVAIQDLFGGPQDGHPLPECHLKIVDKLLDLEGRVDRTGGRSAGVLGGEVSDLYKEWKKLLQEEGWDVLPSRGEVRFKLLRAEAHVKDRRLALARTDLRSASQDLQYIPAHEGPFDRSSHMADSTYLRLQDRAMELWARLSEGSPAMVVTLTLPMVSRQWHRALARPVWEELNCCMRGSTYDSLGTGDREEDLPSADAVSLLVDAGASLGMNQAARTVLEHVSCGRLWEWLNISHGDSGNWAVLARWGQWSRLADPAPHDDWEGALTDTQDELLRLRELLSSEESAFVGRWDGTRLTELRDLLRPHGAFHPNYILNRHGGRTPSVVFSKRPTPGRSAMPLRLTASSSEEQRDTTRDAIAAVLAAHWRAAGSNAESETLLDFKTAIESGQNPTWNGAKPHIRAILDVLPSGLCHRCSYARVATVFARRLPVGTRVELADVLLRLETLVGAGCGDPECTALSRYLEARSTPQCLPTLEELFGADADVQEAWCLAQARWALITRRPYRYKAEMLWAAKHAAVQGPEGSRRALDHLRASGNLQPTNAGDRYEVATVLGAAGDVAHLTEVLVPSITQGNGLALLGYCEAANDCGHPEVVLLVQEIALGMLDLLENNHFDLDAVAMLRVKLILGRLLALPTRNHPGARVSLTQLERIIEMVHASDLEQIDGTSRAHAAILLALTSGRGDEAREQINLRVAYAAAGSISASFARIMNASLVARLIELEERDAKMGSSDAGPLRVDLIRRVVGAPRSRHWLSDLTVPEQKRWIALIESGTDSIERDMVGQDPDDHPLLGRAVLPHWAVRPAIETVARAALIAMTTNNADVRARLAGLCELLDDIRLDDPPYVRIQAPDCDSEACQPRQQIG
jgi:hypothetical protein